MTILTINTGTSPNKGDGDSLRTAFNKINANFAYIESEITTPVNTATVNLGDVTIDGNLFSTVNTDQDILFNPNGTGKVRLLNSTLQFDNASGHNAGQGAQLINTRPGAQVGLGLDGTNSSLRIVGDKQQLGTLVDMGLYTGFSDSWESKVRVDYRGNIVSQGDLSVHGGVTATGVLTALSGVRFPDNSIQTSAVSAFTVSYIQTGTVSGIILNVDTLRFDTESGFTLTDLGSGAVEVSMNSTFKYWEVDGQETLIADGLDHIHIVAGTGLEITTNANADPKSITFSLAGGGLTLGDFFVDGTTLYANDTALNASFANIDVALGTTGASFVQLPSIEDTVGPLFISSPNEIRITTEAGSNNPITISPNSDGYGPGYVVIGSSGSTSTAGLFAFSAAAEINFWPNSEIAALVNGDDAGTLDLYTYDNNNISIRPNGIGTTIVTSVLDVRKTVIVGTSTAGTGGSANSINYLTDAVPLDAGKQIQKLSSGHYYLSPGQEGQMMHFVPVTGAGQSVVVWMQNMRSMMTGSAAEYANAGWYPFSSSSPIAGLSYAIYTDGAWNTSHGYTS